MVKIYTLSSIYDIEKKINLSNIDISDFLNSYHRLLKDDKYIPIFSKTEKYKSFPGNENKKQRNFIHNNKWKLNTDNKSDIKFLFNNLSDSNYDLSLKKIILFFEKTTDLISLFFKELLDKIWFDENISNIYIKLIIDISNNKIIQKKLILVKEKYYYYNNQRYGPFNNIYELNNDVKKNNFFIKEIYNNLFNIFNKRHIFIKNIKSNIEEEYISINKRKIYGTINFMSLLIYNNLININNLKIILDDLLNLESKRKNIDLIELESFYKCWNLFKSNKQIYKCIVRNYSKIINDLLPIKNKRIDILFNKCLDEMNVVKIIKKYDLSYLFKIINNYIKNNNLDEILSEFIKFKIDIKKDILLYQLENNNIYELVINYMKKEEILEYINDFDLSDLELDIPNIKKNVNILLNKI